MKEKAFLICVTAFTAFLCGCGLNQRAEAQLKPNIAEIPAGVADEHVTHGVEFKQGEGLTVPSMTGELLGLKIVDVEEGKATRRVDLALRVFRKEPSKKNGFALASGSVEIEKANFLEPGTEVSIHTPGTLSSSGEVVRIDPASAKLTGLTEVIVRIPTSDILEIGTFVDGHVVLNTEEDVVVIPKKALLKTAEGYFVYVVNGDSLFRTEIGVGGQEGELVEVTDGLYFGDQVVLQPVMPLWLAELQAIRGGKACADGH